MEAETGWMHILSTWCGLSHGPTPVRQEGRGTSGCGLVVRYGRSLEVSYRLDGAQGARVDVLRPDGSKVATLQGSDRACGMALPVELPGGEYLVLVEGGNSRFVAPVHVAA